MEVDMVNKLLTPYNHNSGNIDRIKYIVIHYVGATGGARVNCEYYAGGNRGASAHYYVGFEGEVWQSCIKKQRTQTGYEWETMIYSCVDCTGCPCKKECIKGNHSKTACFSGFMAKKKTEKGLLQ